MSLKDVNDFRDLEPRHALPLTRAQRDELQEENKRLRKWLWLVHGSPVHSLYGDDGEMQCSDCGLDFKRDSVEHLEEVVRAKNMARLVNKKPVA